MREYFDKLRVGFAITGSFCTFEKALSIMENLKERGCEIIPVMSYNAFTTDTRFGKAEEFRARIEEITKKKIICTIADAEPIGPADMTDIMLVAPCTGNTMAKLAMSIIDTPVCLAVKSHLRAGKPVVIAPATNDALAGAYKNIASLMNYKNYFFVPFGQDDYVKKQSSMVADFSLIPAAIEMALDGRQLQPVLI
ncbi:MAG: dipicolinate synthase subunit B [Ruminiclostridium sp.]|nr:dipicolinate synthase subunit B [Ruminiclostridium sp.]